MLEISWEWNTLDYQSEWCCSFVLCALLGLAKQTVNMIQVSEEDAPKEMVDLRFDFDIGITWNSRQYMSLNSVFCCIEVMIYFFF